MSFSLLPLTVSNWKDFEELFGEKGACGGCWCMTWRLTASDYAQKKGEGNKKAMKAVVSRKSPGIIAYDADKPVGWCAVAPRSEYVRLKTSRVLRPVDETEVWSVSCFFIHKQYRRKGLSSRLLKAAVEFALRNGATVVEGYPVEATANKKMPDVFAWTGLSPAFRKCGFTEVARRSPGRPIMRFMKT